LLHPPTQIGRTPPLPPAFSLLSYLSVMILEVALLFLVFYKLCSTLSSFSVASCVLRRGLYASIASERVEAPCPFFSPTSIFGPPTNDTRKKKKLKLFFLDLWDVKKPTSHKFPIRSHPKNSLEPVIASFSCSLGPPTPRTFPFTPISISGGKIFGVHPFLRNGSAAQQRGNFTDLVKQFWENPHLPPPHNPGSSAFSHVHPPSSEHVPPTPGGIWSATSLS